MSSETIPGLPAPSELEAASRRLEGRVHRTPLLTSRTLAERSGAARVLLKCENLQRAGSFKIRGALNGSLRLEEEGRLPSAGLLTYSSGNHGQAVALAARSLGVPATIVVPEDIPEVKRAAIEGYGARLETAGLTSGDRHERALAIEAATGAAMIEPFDHADTIAGQSTVGREILEDASPSIDDILVPTGGGGLLAGIALAVERSNAGEGSRARIWSVEPHSANALALSLAAGEIRRLDHPSPSVADGLRPASPGILNFAVARRLVESVLLVDDQEIIEAQRLLLDRAKLFVEPSGAATTAALLHYGETFRDRNVVVVLSGGNAASPWTSAT